MLVAEVGHAREEGYHYSYLEAPASGSHGRGQVNQHCATTRLLTGEVPHGMGPAWRSAD